MSRELPQSGRTALLIVGHGTRDPRGQAEFLELAGLITQRLPEFVVRPAYLELASPDIPTAIDELASTGQIERLFVLPLLLFAAGHAKRDIPQAVAAAVARHGPIETRQLPHLGTSPSVARLSASRMQSALFGRTAIAPDATWGVLVGRGSHDPDAREEWRAFSASRRETTPLGEWAECFLAMAKPTPEELLPALLAQPLQRIIWQPHLLFHGELYDRVRDFVAMLAEKHPEREWIVTEHLGPDPSLADGVAEMVRAGHLLT